MFHRFAPSVLLLSLALVCAGAPASADDAKAPPAPPIASLSPLGAAPWLGVSMNNGGDTGVRIEHIVRGSPADKSGLRAGDRIVAVDGARVTGPAQVTRGVATHKVGETVTVGLERTGTALSASVVLAARPSSDDLVRMHLVGAPAPEWSTAAVLSGAPASVGALRGKVAVLDFWASWCVPCRMIAPRLGALKDRLGAQGLAVVGITTDEPEQAAAFSERHQMRYPSVVDKDAETSAAYGISGLPTMVLVDKSGVVRDVFVGFDTGSEARLEAAIRKLLAEPAPAKPADGKGAAPRAPTVPRPDGR